MVRIWFFVVFLVFQTVAGAVEISVSAEKQTTHDSLTDGALVDSSKTSLNENNTSERNGKKLLVKIALFLACALVVTIVSTAFGPLVLGIEIIAFIITATTPDVPIYIPIIGKYILLWQML